MSLPKDLNKTNKIAFKQMQQLMEENEILKVDKNSFKESLKIIEKQNMELSEENEQIKQENGKLEQTLKGINWLDGKKFSISGLLKTIRELRKDNDELRNGDNPEQREQDRRDKYVCAAMQGILSNTDIPGYYEGEQLGETVLKTFSRDALLLGKACKQAADEVGKVKEKINISPLIPPYGKYEVIRSGVIQGIWNEDGSPFDIICPPQLQDMLCFVLNELRTEAKT